MEDCTEKTDNPLIVLEENGKKMTFINRKRKVIKKIEVDGCAITEGIRCDWLVINDQDYEHFVELKGIDVLHACSQLGVSITKLSANPTQDAKHSFVIARRIMPATNTTIQILKVQFKKKFNCTLIVKNRQCSFDL